LPGAVGQAHARQCDVASADAVQALAQEAERLWGGVDLVVNNAGVAVSGAFEDIPLADWSWIVGINLMGVVHGCRSFLPGMRAQGSGHLINVASAAGLLSPPRAGPYNATKAAVVAISETLHAELERTAIGVTVLCPTFFPTHIGKSARATDDVDAAMIEKMMRRSRLSAEDVARHALACADNGELYALPHADGRWLWRLKRATPAAFPALIPRLIALQRRLLRRGAGRA